MKYLIVLLLSVSLASCKKDTASATSTTDTITQENKTVDSVALLKQFGGLWISDSYLTAIEKTKSVYANREYTSAVLGFEFNKQLNHVWGFSEHEGGTSWPVTYNPATNRYTYDITRKEDYQEAQDFVLYKVGDNLIEIAHAKPARKERYRRISAKSDIYALNYELNRMLFEGSYTDSLSGKKVSFGRKGNVSGFGDMAYYLILNDFGEGLEFDTVLIDKNKEQEGRQTYHFEIKGTTIHLFATTNNEEQLTYTINPTPAFVLKKDKL
ncbi:hypothetical protein AM493_09885 [Flavobacterium akiainvivens]|uniref:Lipoprotein n=1 Tax=Flavobacterium akiainvivens TaxID=1202724 RepID=A0A0M8MIK7_9FLAO|nr:hypothetical protein [Flavobacterium akiainvivens]KOS06308.1 hypothetical protein AM493_09885 [Flavobacterium akiainvivens]SFQ16661.1 hypothetical protein SAMN05444144_101388 [Flavobacterium akiainvivens]